MEILAYKFYQEENHEKLVSTSLLVVKLKKNSQKGSVKINEKASLFITGLVVTLSIGLSSWLGFKSNH